MLGALLRWQCASVCYGRIGLGIVGHGRRPVVVEVAQVLSTLVNHLAATTGMLREQMRMRLRGDGCTGTMSAEFGTLTQIQTLDAQHLP